MAQWESVPFTRGRSLVRSQLGPPKNRLSTGGFFRSGAGVGTFRARDDPFRANRRALLSAQHRLGARPVASSRGRRPQRNRSRGGPVEIEPALLFSYHEYAIAKCEDAMGRRIRRYPSRRSPPGWCRRSIRDASGRRAQASRAAGERLDALRGLQGHATGEHTQCSRSHAGDGLGAASDNRGLPARLSCGQFARTRRRVLGGDDISRVDGVAAGDPCDARSDADRTL